MKTTQEILNEEIPSAHHRPAPGWHHTDKFGDIFVSPDGIQQSSQRLINVTVKLDQSDIIKTPAIERVKHAQMMRCYRKTRTPITSMPNLALSDAEAMNK
jgi:hypothetical protein